MPFSLHGFPAPFRRRFPALPYGHGRVSHADGLSFFKVHCWFCNKKIATQQPEPDHPFRDGLGSGSLCSDKKVKNLLRSTAQTRTFENTLISAACKKKQGKLWQKERGPDGAGPLDRMMRCSKTSAAFITVFKNSADQNGIFMICSLRILLRWENRIRQKDKVSAGKIRTRR